MAHFWVSVIRDFFQGIFKLWFKMLDSWVPNYGNLCHSMILSWQILNCSPSNVDHSSSKLVCWIFSTSVLLLLSSIILLLLSTFYSGFRSSSHGPEHESSLLFQYPSSKLTPPPCPKHLAGLLCFLVVMAPE